MAKGANTAHDVSKLQDFADSFCQSLEGKIRYIESNLPSLAELLYSSSRPLISMADATEIVKTLERIGAINNNQFCPNAVEIIKQSQLGEGEKYRDKISSFASRVIASSSKDYKSAINHLITQQSSRVSKSLMGHYQHQLANPIIQEGMQQISLSDKITDTLLGDSYRLNDAIRNIQSKNGHRVINLAGPKIIPVAAGDDDGSIMMRGKEKNINSKPALKFDPNNTNVQPGLTIGQPQKLDKSLFGTGEESAQGTSRQLGTVDSIGNGYHPELVSGYRPITAADIGFAGLTSADIALLLTQPKSPLPVPLSQKTAEYLNSVTLQSGWQQPSSTEVNKQSGEFTLDEQASIAAVGGDIGLDYDPRTKIFIKENPWAALELAAAPYVGMGVGLLGRIGFGATARLLPTIAAEGGGGSSIVGSSQLANPGSRLLMTDATTVGANVGARIGSTAATATPINPLYTAVNATTAAATLHYSLKAIEDTNNLLGQNYSPTNTDRSVPQQSQATATQPVKVWDVNKPLPTNINPCAIIDLNANKPIILTTPIPSEKPITVISTPDQGELLRKLGTLPGFDHAPSESIDTNTESFPAHVDSLLDTSILYKNTNDFGVDKQLIKDVEKLKLDRNNPTDQKILENLDTPVEEFIAKNRKAKIFREFPGEYLDVPLREVMEGANRGDSIAKKAKKLLIDGRFSK